MARSLMRVFLCILAACALFDLAGAQTLSPEPKAPEPKTTESKASDASAKAASRDTSAPAADKAEQTTIPVSVSLPTVHVLGSVVPPETLKAAHDAGYQTKVANGTTHFCKTEAEIGSRFKKETCINEEQLDLVLHRSEEQRERLNSLVGSSTHNK